MVAVLLILIALLILAFAAVPFDMTEGILNTGIVTMQWGVNMLCAGLSWVTNTIGQIAVGILNWATVWIVDSLAALGIIIPGMTQTWDNLAFGFDLGTVDFSAMGYDTTFSPIGVALSNWVTDPFTANALGSIALVILAGIVLFVVVKVPKPPMPRNRIGKPRRRR